SGQATPEGSMNEQDFTLDNSAYLASGIAAQIFCGYFPIEEREEQPKEVSINFNLMMKNVNNIQILNNNRAFEPVPLAPEAAPAPTEGVTPEATTTEEVPEDESVIE